MIVLIYVIAAIVILGLGYTIGKNTGADSKKELKSQATDARLRLEDSRSKNDVLTSALVSIRTNPDNASIEADIALNEARTKEINQ